MTLPNISNINSYGGPFADALPQQDPQTELASSAYNATINDCSAMTATVPRLVFQFIGSAGTPALASTATWAAGVDSVWGNAPANNPVLTHLTTGAVHVELPAEVTDQLGNQISVNVRFVEVSSAIATANWPTSIPQASCDVLNSSSFNIFLAQSLAADDCVGILLTVKVY